MVEVYPYATVFYSKSKLFKDYGKDVGIYIKNGLKLA